MIGKRPKTSHQRTVNHHWAQRWEILVEQCLWKPQWPSSTRTYLVNMKLFFQTHRSEIARGWRSSVLSNESPRAIFVIVFTPGLHDGVVPTRGYKHVIPTGSGCFWNFLLYLELLAPEGPDLCRSRFKKFTMPYYRLLYFARPGALRPDSSGQLSKKSALLRRFVELKISNELDHLTSKNHQFEITPTNNSTTRNCFAFCIRWTICTKGTAPLPMKSKSHKQWWANNLRQRAYTWMEFQRY